MEAAVQLLFMIGLYLLPSIVAEVRKAPSKGSVFVINIFLGWTIIGWIVALAMAARDVPPARQPNQFAQPPQPNQFAQPPQPDQFAPPPQPDQFAPPPQPGQVAQPSQQRTYRRPNPLRYRGN